MDFKLIEEDLNSIVEKEVELERKRELLDEEIMVLDKDKSYIVYKLYKEFVDKNWNCLNKNDVYYYIHLDWREKKGFRLQKVKFNQMYANDKFAVFSPLEDNVFCNMNINVSRDDSEAEYTSSCVIIDNNQLLELAKITKFYTV